jgi:hypothetical protein
MTHQDASSEADLRQRAEDQIRREQERLRRG